MFKIEVFGEGMYFDPNGVEVTGFLSANEVERMKELLAHLGIAEYEQLVEVFYPYAGE